jgi:hypothetical protein
MIDRQGYHSRLINWSKRIESDIDKLSAQLVHLWEQTTSILKLKDQIEGKGRHERTLLPGHDRGIIVG